MYHIYTWNNVPNWFVLCFACNGASVCLFVYVNQKFKGWFTTKWKFWYHVLAQNMYIFHFLVEHKPHWPYDYSMSMFIGAFWSLAAPGPHSPKEKLGKQKIVLSLYNKKLRNILKNKLRKLKNLLKLVALNFYCGSSFFYSVQNME